MYALWFLQCRGHGLRSVKSAKDSMPFLSHYPVCIGLAQLEPILRLVREGQKIIPVLLNRYPILQGFYLADQNQLVELHLIR